MIEAWSEAKSALTAASGMTENLLHVHIGLAIFVVAALLLRRRMRSPVPLAIVVALAFLNEVADFAEAGPWDPLESGLDFANSVVWPAILFLLARRAGGRGGNRTA